VLALTLFLRCHWNYTPNLTRVFSVSLSAKEIQVRLSKEHSYSSPPSLPTIPQDYPFSFCNRNGPHTRLDHCTRNPMLPLPGTPYSSTTYALSQQPNLPQYSSLSTILSPTFPAYGRSPSPSSSDKSPDLVIVTATDKTSGRNKARTWR